MNKVLRIGTRDSQLAVWQASLVQEQLKQQGVTTELVYIKSEGDLDLVSPLYEIGVAGIFTKTLDAALLSNRIDLAVHSMKDVPTQLAKGIAQAAVLKRASHKDLLVFKEPGILQTLGFENGEWPIADTTSAMRQAPLTIATSSVRRKAQWLNRYPHHTIENLRGNVNTRLQKLDENNWDGAIFAAAGLERINLRPETAVELDWMLPAPAQGAIVVVCREEEQDVTEICSTLHDADTALTTKIERDFLRALLGGCTTPISALATVTDNMIHFRGNILSLDGKEKIELFLSAPVNESHRLGTTAANQLLAKGAAKIVTAIRNANTC